MYVNSNICTHKYDALVDRNSSRRNAPADYSHGPTTFYGQLLHVISVTLPTASPLGLTEPTNFILADIHTCNADIDGPLNFKMYDDMSTKQVFDMTCVQGLVGRLQVLSLNSFAKPVWAIVDRSQQSDGAIYIPDDDDVT